MRNCALAVIIFVLFCATGCNARPSKMSGPLISSHTTMVTAWDFPKNPLTDKTLDDPKLFDSKIATQIRTGFKIFTDTPHQTPQFAPGKISCSNCHLNGGQRERSLPLVGIAGAFPEYNKRSGRLYSLADRIVDCFVRSENATGAAENELPNPASKEVLSVAAYLSWLARGYEMGKSPAWRGQNTIESGKLIPIAKLDRSKGEALFMERCTNCHGENGQGVQIGDKKPGPLWGPDSWNDGAGAARIYTLAGIIRYSMPYLDPGSLSDEEAQEIAAFIDSKPRPEYPFKQLDYKTEKLPPDSVYYTTKK